MEAEFDGQIHVCVCVFVCVRQSRQESVTLLLIPHIGVYHLELTNLCLCVFVCVGWRVKKGFACKPILLCVCGFVCLHEYVITPSKPLAYSYHLFSLTWIFILCHSSLCPTALALMNWPGVTHSPTLPHLKQLKQLEVMTPANVAKA